MSKELNFFSQSTGTPYYDSLLAKGEALLALVKGEWVSMRIPYPLGFFSKNADGRIDDPKAGWKGRGFWTTSGTRANFHGEGGVDAYPKVFKVQMRPNPLAH